MKETPPQHVLKIACPDAKGLVHHITGCLYRHGLNVVANGEFVEPDSNRFFMRTALEGDVDREQVVSELRTALPKGAEIELLVPRRKRIVVLVSKEAHCLGDILVRCQFGEINAELLAVVGNHDRLRGLVEQAGYPYHHLSHEEKDRAQHEAEVQSVLDEYDPDYVVLAKYMRILSAEMVARYPRKMINIHHSFLPAFVGANPYRQAYERGVKIIGATAHFVTADLDEGPIIEQDVFRVMHQNTPAEMAQAGRSVEKHVLNRAIDLVFDDRVFISGNKTVVF